MKVPYTILICNYMKEQKDYVTVRDVSEASGARYEYTYDILMKYTARG